MSTKTNKLLAGIGLAVGGVTLGCAALYTEIMTSVIARRRNDFTDAIVAATGEAAPLDETVAATIREKAQALRDLGLEQVSIRSKEGYVLRAHWYPAPGATRTLILAHGWRSRWDVDFSVSAPFFHDCGCNLLFIDQRCHGDSGGDLIAYGILERHDIVAWLDWLDEHHRGVPVYLCGVSMGASAALMTAELPVADRVTAIIADCGYSTPDGIVKRTVKKTLGGMTGPTLAAVNINCKLRCGFTLKSASPVKAMAQNTEIPCLFIHGDADTFVPVRMSIENYYACRAPKELFVVPGAGHGLSYLVNTEGYRRKVLDFFEAWDNRLPPPAPAETKKKKRLGKKRSAETV